MSQSALCMAVRDTIRTALILGDDPNKCDLSIDGSPAPAAGQVFYAVHPYGWDTQNGDYDLDEIFGVKVTVSKKLGSTPKDRTLVAAWATPTTGLDALVRQVIPVVHRNQAIRLAANTILGLTENPDGPNGFQTELWFLGADAEPVQRDADWFGAAPATGSVGIMGISVTARFGRAERIQGLLGMK